MAFNFYFASMTDNNMIPYFCENGYNLLYSNVNDRNTIPKVLNIGMKGNFFLDSGAHSAHTKGKEVDVDDYINFINTHDKDITCFVQVDKIPGQYLKPKTQKEMEEAPELSWENYLYMRDKVNSPDKLIPVFHQGEDFKWLKNMCNTTFDGKHIPYIGLSPRGDVGLEYKYDFCAKCFEVIESSKNPNVKTHAFGMTSLELLEKLPFYSADSTTYLHVAAYGQVWTPYGKIGVSEENKKHPTAPTVYWFLDDKEKKVLDEYFESIDTNIDELRKHHIPRTIANAKFCRNWAENYEYKGLKSFVSSKPLF